MFVRDIVARVKNFLLLSVLLPFVYGCNGGGGTEGSSASGFSGSASDAVSFLLSGGATTGGIADGGITGGGLPPIGGGVDIIIPAGGGAIGGPDALAQLHNPEPATMLLLGGGIVAMTYLKSRMKK